MKDPLSYQIGGDHYSKYKIQPVEIIQNLNMDFLRANILKYLVRYRDKNGIEDLRKAHHYATMLSARLHKEQEMIKEFISQFPDDENSGLQRRALDRLLGQADTWYCVEPCLHEMILEEEKRLKKEKEQ